MRGDYWLFFAVLILIISLATHQVPLVLITLLFILTGGVSRLWNRFCLHRVEYKRRLSQNQAFFGDEIFFEVEITNRKPLPMPWLQIDDELPEHVALLKGKAVTTHDDRVILSNMRLPRLFHACPSFSVLHTVKHLEVSPRFISFRRPSLFATCTPDLQDTESSWC